MSHFLHVFVQPQPAVCLPPYPAFTVSLPGLCEPNCQFICYEPITRLFKEATNALIFLIFFWLVSTVQNA